MEDTGNQRIQDPSADSCFLAASNDEPRDTEVPTGVLLMETTSSLQDANVTIPTVVSSVEVVDSKNTNQTVPELAMDNIGFGLGVTRFKNPDALHQANARLPSGEEIDSKNTLQSIHVPANSGSDGNDLLARSTLPPSAIDTESSHPTLPSGEIIDSKNTLQSFNTRSAGPPTNRAPSDGNNNTPESELLPTAAAWIPPSQLSEREVPAAETVYVAELIATDTPRRNNSLLWMIFGILAIVGTSVIAGVCFSGNCGSSNAVDPEVESAVSEYINSISYVKQAIFANGTSAESQALRWLIEEDNLFSNEVLLMLNSQEVDEDVRHRVRQRYSLATFWVQSSENWKSTESWLSKLECRWFGITCDESGSVTEILFYDYDSEVANGFVGSISPDIGLLSSLRNFSMRSNDVTGTIPESIGNCNQMYLFDIRGCSVTGTVPSSMRNLTNLFYLDVLQSELTMNPLVESVVSAFVNNITYFHQPSLLNSTKAERRALTWLMLEDTLFNKSTLMSLNSADVNNEVSFRVRQRYTLATLWFQQLNKEGKFVATWKNTLGWLQDESECDWFGITCDESEAVTEIAFYDSGFIGSIPPDTGLLTSLQNFSMQSNNVYGTIPESIGNCNQMISFDIHNCLITGTIPRSLGQWTDLIFFDLSYNFVSGTIPDSLGQWTDIQVVDLKQNLISGAIPGSLGQWIDVNVFDLSYNKITGTIPLSLGQWTDVSVFDVTGNAINGTIPDFPSGQA